MRVKLLVEQTLRLEEFARNGNSRCFPMIAPLPETVAAGKPAVSLSARTTRANPQKKNPGNPRWICLAIPEWKCHRYPASGHRYLDTGWSFSFRR